MDESELIKEGHYAAFYLEGGMGSHFFAWYFTPGNESQPLGQFGPSGSFSACVMSTPGMGFKRPRKDRMSSSGSITTCPASLAHSPGNDHLKFG
jgi:hypothetical protein